MTLNSILLLVLLFFVVVNDEVQALSHSPSLRRRLIKQEVILGEIR